MASSKLPRFMHRWWAWRGGYFWIPCPLCREMWGGHEWGHGAALPHPTKPGIARGVCNDCAPDVLLAKAGARGYPFPDPSQEQTWVRN